MWVLSGTRVNVIARGTYSARTDHDDRALGVGWKSEGRPPDMNGRFEYGVISVGTPWTLDGIRRCLKVEQCHLGIGSVLEVQQEVASDTIAHLGW